MSGAPYPNKTCPVTKRGCADCNGEWCARRDVFKSEPSPIDKKHEAERLAAWLESVGDSYDPVGPEYRNAANLLRELASSSDLPSEKDGLWNVVRLYAEGSDWQRDNGESLGEWAGRKLAPSASSDGIGLSAHEASVIAAAVALAPLLEEGWDDQDTPEDRNEGAKACDALVAAVNAMLAAPQYVVPKE